jgi:hypothetical protein
MSTTNENTSNELIESRLAERLKALQANFAADGIAYCGSLGYGVDDLIRDAIEKIRQRSTLKRLLVILETDGGSIDIAERIANTFRHHFEEVDFVVPNFAYSAGTILTMAGDRIYMDYYSLLGPIDPQVRKDVGWVPALGYLLKYEELIAKSNAGTITSAEIAFLCDRFDPAELHAFEQAKEQSITLLRQWLAKYKFKDWHTTETSKTPVTAKMKEDRAAEIADKLNDTKQWHSHSRGIPMRSLREILNLKIEDFGAMDPAGGHVRSYYKLLKDYMMRRGADAALHTEDGFLKLSSE